MGVLLDRGGGSWEHRGREQEARIRAAATEGQMACVCSGGCEAGVGWPPSSQGAPAESLWAPARGPNALLSSRQTHLERSLDMRN